MGPHAEYRTWALAELADATGTTPRTIRYYIQQGLLRSPGTGSQTRYDSGHRDRVLLIKQLQRQHLPLAEIRRRLETLDDRAVAALLAEHGSAHASDDTALAYVRRVLRGQGTVPAARPVAVAEVPVPYASTPAPSMAPAGAAVTATAVPPAVAPDRSQWERVVLAPEIELHIRRPLTRHQNRAVERLVALARTLLEEGTR